MRGTKMKFFIYITVSALLIIQANTYGTDPLEQIDHEGPLLKEKLCPRGPRGQKGKKGETGSKGRNGDRGTLGPQGSAGLEGAAGSTGPIGIEGSEGIQGGTGPTGPVQSVIFADAYILVDGSTSLGRHLTLTPFLFTTISSQDITTSTSGGGSLFTIHTDGYYRITSSLVAHVGNPDEEKVAFLRAQITKNGSTSLRDFSLQFHSINQGGGDTPPPQYSTQVLIVPLQANDTLSLRYATDTGAFGIYLGVALAPPSPYIGASLSIRRTGTL